MVLIKGRMFVGGVVGQRQGCREGNSLCKSLEKEETKAWNKEKSQER